MPTLVAMSRGGDMLITEDNGVSRLHLPPGAGGVSILSGDEAYMIISRADLSMVDEDFRTWGDLAAAVQRRVADGMELPGIDTTEWDAIDVREMLDVVDDLLDEDDNAEAVQLLDFLLGLSLVRDDDHLYRETKERLVAVQQPMPELAHFPTKVPREVTDRAHRQWERVAA